ncbi:hypothetical protein TALC_00600 [Thermoplasmatales archaeon BRNA1]|nr:hypothetical protein TALC_00600 [Thermoplasmatales archaeon BRNA1]
MKLKERQKYALTLPPSDGNGCVTVVRGVHRSGKTSLLKFHVCRDVDISTEADGRLVYGCGSDGDTNVLALDVGLAGNYHLRDVGILSGFVKGRIEDGKHNVVLIDGIEHVKGWEPFATDLARGGADIYVTGPIPPTGGDRSLEVFTLTFRECLDFAREYHGRFDMAYVFDRFIRIGGFPDMWRGDTDQSEVVSRAKGILSSCIVSDVEGVNVVKDTDFLLRLLYYISARIGNYTSLLDLVSAASSDDGAVKRSSVNAYVSYLEDASIIHRCETMDIRGGRVLPSKCRFYLADVAFIDAVRGYISEEDTYERLLNIIYLELRSRGYSVYTGDYGGHTIDFVGEKDGRRIYVQLSDGDSDRKATAMKRVRDGFPRFMVMMGTKGTTVSADGSNVMSPMDFLSSDVY